MNITLYKFSKRANSTKRPSGGVKVYGRLNNKCGITAPSVIFSEDFHSYNYAYIPTFNRFYWVEEWTYSNGVWIAEMAVDVLASYRSEIGGSQQYVTRASAAYDGSIVDGLYPAKSKYKNIVKSKGVWSELMLDPSPYFVVGIVGGKTKANTGIVTYYQMDDNQFTIFSDMVFGSIDYMGTDFGTDMTLDYMRTQVNPFQYIVSVKKYPFPTRYAAPTSTIRLGWWTINFNCEIIDSIISLHVDEVEIDIPKHPQKQRGDYLLYAPYSRYSLYIPYFGTKDIPSEWIADINKLYLRIVTDVTSDTSIVYLQSSATDSYSSFMQFNGSIGQTVIIGQSASNKIGAGLGVISAVGNLLTGNFVGAASSISDAVSNMSPTLNTQGENTGFAEASQPAKLICSFIEICDDDNANNGRPLMQVKTISSIPGYIKCENSDIAIQGTDSECTKIKSLMDGGFFYE